MLLKPPELQYDLQSMKEGSGKTEGLEHKMKLREMSLHMESQTCDNRLINNIRVGELYMKFRGMSFWDP